jgi:hypothetical protein
LGELHAVAVGAFARRIVLLEWLRELVPEHRAQHKRHVAVGVGRKRIQLREQFE